MKWIWNSPGFHFGSVEPASGWELPSVCASPVREAGPAAAGRVAAKSGAEAAHFRKSRLFIEVIVSNHPLPCKRARSSKCGDVAFP